MHRLFQLLFIVTAFSFYAYSDPYQWTVKSCVGDVQIRRADNPDLRKARVGLRLNEGDVIRSGAESEAEIEAKDGSTIYLGESSVIHLSKSSTGARQSKHIKVKIFFGSVYADARKLLKKNEKFEFETPTATAAIRGTQVGFDVIKEQTQVRVYEGIVYVKPRAARQGREIVAGQMTIVKKHSLTVKGEKLKELENRKFKRPATYRKPRKAQERSGKSTANERGNAEKAAYRASQPDGDTKRIAEGEIKAASSTKTQGQRKQSSNKSAPARLKASAAKEEPEDSDIPVLTGPSIRGGKACFGIKDQPDENLTFYIEIDGEKLEKTGQAGGQFCIDLREGFHKYTAYGVNSAGKSSKKWSQRVPYVRPNSWSISMRRPMRNETISQNAARRGYRVEFSVVNLPQNDPQLLLEAVVENRNNRRQKSEKPPRSVDMNFTIELGRGRNQLDITVRDINNEVQKKQVVITVN